MQKNFKALELSSLINGCFYGTNNSIKGFSIDSRKINKGDVFIALKGSRFDGHDFIREAFEKGAVGVISEKDIVPPKGKFVIKVNSTIKALQKIAKYKRSIFKGKVIGVAGSAGKTTTKELIAHLLSFKGKVFKTPGNLNSQIGLPLALANAPVDVNFWVLELGASKLGEIRKLTEISLPHIRVITSLGEEHLEGFGSIENVIKGNGEIFEYWNENSFAIIPDYAKDFYTFLPEDRIITFGNSGIIKAKDIEISLEGTSFSVENTKFFVPVISKGIVDNVLASFGVLKALGYSIRDFKEKLRSFKQEWGRMELLRFKDFIVINDAYNANPLSFKNFLETAREIPFKKKIFILGDMLELGKHSKFYHEEVGKVLNSLNPYIVVFFGENMKFTYDVYQGKKFYAKTYDELVKILNNLKNEFKDSLVLLKGSRGMRLERIIEIWEGR